MRISPIALGLSLLFGITAAAQTTPETIGPVWVTQVQDGDTITVRLSDDETMEVRYLGMNAPELSDTRHLGGEAKRANSALVEGTAVWLEVGKRDGVILKDRDGRVLAHVFLDADRTRLVQEELIQEGLGIIDFPGLKDREVAGDAFPVAHISRLIAAQLGAVAARRGVWKLEDFYPNEPLAIAAIAFWGDTETVYIINRGSTPLDLAADLSLLDESAYQKMRKGANPTNRLSFRKFFGPRCPLPPMGVLLVYTGPGITEGEKGKRTGCASPKVEAYWTRRKVWNNSADAGYLIAPDGEIRFVYRYPPFRSE